MRYSFSRYDLRLVPCGWCGELVRERRSGRRRRCLRDLRNDDISSTIAIGNEPGQAFVTIEPTDVAFFTLPLHALAEGQLTAH